MSIILDGTKGETFPSWTTAGRPASPNAGQTGYNTTLSTLEYYDGTNWRQNYITSGTVNAGGTSPFPASGGPTSVIYNNIPSWTKRITFMLNGVSSSGTSSFIIQLGTGTSGSPTWTTSGYTGAAQYANSAISLIYSTNAAGIYVIVGNLASSIVSSSISINLLDASTNTWATSFTSADGASANVYMVYSAWSVPLSATATQIRLTTVNGTDTFDAGKVNIFYE